MMYVQIDKDNRCISACSERQSDSDILLEACTDEFLSELHYYIYDPNSDKFIRDENYKPDVPKSQLEILQEAVDMLILDNLEVL